jgi:hypothetical protein
VEAELRSKGVYEQDPVTGSLIHKGREISIVFMYDPYTDEVMGLIDDDNNDRSR